MDDADVALADEPRQHAPPQGESTTEIVTRRRCELPHGCSEPRPRQAEIRIADKVFSMLAKAALENEHIDKATAAMGIAQKLKEEEKVVVARGGGSTSEQKGLAPVVARESGGRLEREGNVLGESPNLQHVLRYSKENPNCRSLERVAHAGPAPECEGGLQFSSVTSSKQPYKAHCWQACALFFLRDKVGASQRTSSFRCKDATTIWQDVFLQ